MNPYPGVLVILISIAKVIIPKVLVDTESALNILYTSTLKWISIPIHFLQPYLNMVLGLNGALTRAKEFIKLTVEIRKAPRQVRLNVEFMVFGSP